MFTLRTARNSSELFDLNIVSPRVGCLPACLLVLGVKPYQRLKSISVSSLRPREKKTDSTTYRPFTAETTFRALMSTSDLNVQCRRRQLRRKYCHPPRGEMVIFTVFFSKKRPVGYGRKNPYPLTSTRPQMSFDRKFFGRQSDVRARNRDEIDVALRFNIFSSRSI